MLSHRATAGNSSQDKKHGRIASRLRVTGFPEINNVRVSSATVALTQVAQVLTVEPRGTTRVEDVNMVDLSLRRSISAGRYRVTPVMDIFNLLNAAPIKSRTTRLGPTLGRVRDIQRGRIIKCGLNVDF